MDNIEKEIRSAMPAVLERVKVEALNRMERDALAVAIAVAADEARKWAAEVLAPEIRAQLEAGKESMVSKAQDISRQLADGIGDALVKTAIERLSSNWNLKKVADALFG